MIDKPEIDAKAEELGVHAANVQRDYVFGWLLCSVYRADNPLRPLLVLKGGNCFRKAYFEHARFSNDLDFSTQTELDVELLLRGLKQACAVAGESSGVEFLIDDSRVSEKRLADSESLLVDDEARQGALRFAEQAGGPFLREEGVKRIPPLVELPKLLSAAEHVMEEKDTEEDLRLLFAPGSSLGGARPKASVIEKDGHLAIAKFPRKDDEINTVVLGGSRSRTGQQSRHCSTRRPRRNHLQKTCPAAAAL